MDIDELFEDAFADEGFDRERGIEEEGLHEGRGGFGKGLAFEFAGEERQEQLDVGAVVSDVPAGFDEQPGVGGSDPETMFEVVLVEAGVEQAQQVVELGCFEACAVGAGPSHFFLPLGKGGGMVVEALHDLFRMRPEEGAGVADGGGFPVGDADPTEAEGLVGTVDVEAVGESLIHADGFSSGGLMCGGGNSAARANSSRTGRTWA